MNKFSVGDRVRIMSENELSGIYGDVNNVPHGWNPQMNYLFGMEFTINDIEENCFGGYLRSEEGIENKLYPGEFWYISPEIVELVNQGSDTNTALVEELLQLF